MSPTATAATVVTDGGTASPSNPPLQITLWKSDGSGGWTQVSDLGGGGVKTVVGKAPDTAGNVALTHADLGPIQVGDLGFDPETQAEFDSALLTINGSIKAALQEMRSRASASSPLFWFDDFERSTLNPTPALIGGNYTILDSSGVASINAGRYISSGNSYLCRTFAGRRVVGFGGEFSVNDIRPAKSGLGGGALILCKESSFNPSTSSFLHVTFKHDGYYATIWTPGSANTPLESGDSYVSLSTPLATDGSRHVFTVSVNGTEVTIRFGGATYTHTDSRLLAIFGATGAGPTVIWQAGDDAENRYRLAWDSVTAIGAQGATRPELALKRDISDSYSKAQVDALVSSVAPYSTTTTYKAGDVAVSPSGDLVRANGAISPPTAIAHVGASTNATGAASIALPAGSAAGDLALVAFGGYAASPPTISGFTKIASTDVGQNASIDLWAKLLVAADITAGSVSLANVSSFTVTTIRVYRGAAMPTVKSSTPTTSTTAGATVASPSVTVASGSDLFRVFSVFSNSSNGSGSPTPPSGLTDNSTAGPRSSNTWLTSGRVAYSSATVTLGSTTIPSGSSLSYAAMSVEVPLAAGYNSGQWTTLVSGFRLPKRVAVADANYAADGTEDVIAYTSLSGSGKTVTLPLASSVTPGKPVQIVDEANGIIPGTRRIGITRSGSDSVGGSTTIYVDAVGGSLTLYANPAGAWVITRDAALAGKLDNTAGAVGLTNLAANAKPAINLDGAAGADGSSITAGLGHFAANLPADGSIALPSAAAHGTNKLLLVTTNGTSSTLPTYTLTLTRNGSDVIGRTATSLVVPPGIGYTLLRSNGIGRWDVIAGAGAPGVPGRVAVTAAATIAATTSLQAVSGSAANTQTLPAASAVPAGREVVVKDANGTAATNNITVARASSDTIDGATSIVISSNYGKVRLASDGVSKWDVI